MEQQNAFSFFKMDVETGRTSSGLLDPEVIDFMPSIYEGKSIYMFYVGEAVWESIKKYGISRGYQGSLTPYGGVISLNFVAPAGNLQWELAYDFDVSLGTNMDFLEKLMKQSEIDVAVVNASNGQAVRWVWKQAREQKMELKDFVAKCIERNDQLVTLDFAKAVEFVATSLCI